MIHYILIIIISLFIFCYNTSEEFNVNTIKNTTCSWKCVANKCKKQCKNKCAKPACRIDCDPIPNQKCTVDCDIPDCKAICPNNKDHCYTKCTKAKCKLKCFRWQIKSFLAQNLI